MDGWSRGMDWALSSRKVTLMPHRHSSRRRAHPPHAGRCSSHLRFLRRQLRHPVLVRVRFSLGRGGGGGGEDVSPSVMISGESVVLQDGSRTGRLPMWMWRCSGRAPYAPDSSCRDGDGDGDERTRAGVCADTSKVTDRRCVGGRRRVVEARAGRSAEGILGVVMTRVEGSRKRRSGPLGSRPMLPAAGNGCRCRYGDVMCRHN